MTGILLVPGLANGWTGGQYSLCRAVLGLYLWVHFAQLVPRGGELFSRAGAVQDAAANPFIRFFPNILALADAPFVTALLGFGALASLLFAAGYRDRPAAVLLCYLLACLYVRNPLVANPGLPFVGWLLLAHAALPSAPYGSWAARGRSDPRGGAQGPWHLPATIFAASWIVMALAYSFSGYTKVLSPSWVDGTALARMLENPLAGPTAVRELVLGLPAILLQVATWGTLALELLFAPLALIRRLRPWLWTVLLALHLGLIPLIGFADLSFGMMFLHLFTFNPAWLPAARPGAREYVFYDGHCGLCHRAVRFLLAEDTEGELFRFAPLDSEAFRDRVPAAQRAALPDSIIVLTDDGRLLARSGATLHAAARLGGYWRLLAIGARLIPTPLRDAVYDGIARVRHRLFRAPSEACPLMPPSLRERFELGAQE